MLLLFMAVLFIQEPETTEEKWEPTEIQQEMYDEAMRLRGRRASEQVLDEECTEIAQRWAEHMAARGRMYHGGGEQIIAYGYPSVPACFNGWMNSSGHRRWVLSGSPKCGYGAARGRNGRWYYAGCFQGNSGPSNPGGGGGRYNPPRRGFFRWWRR